MRENASNVGWQGMHGALLFALVMSVPFVQALQSWPWLWVGPLAAYFLLVAIIPPLRACYRSPRFGRVTPLAIGATLFIAVTSSGVLVAFHLVAKPDMRAYAGVIPVRALGGIVAAGICFSLLNAFLEELVFRSVLFESIESQWGSWGAICGTAALFGFAHIHGYPPGIAGAILAGIYGVALGWLRMFTRGIGRPAAAHIFADATIYCFLARSGIL